MKQILFFTLSLLFFWNYAIADNSGAHSPSSVSGSGTNPWTNPSAAATADGNYAYAFVPYSGQNYSAGLRGTSYGFTVPGNAVITGIVVSMKRYATDPGMSDGSVRLIKGGVTQGNNKGLYSWTNIPDETVTYGGSSDLWGLTFTPTDINSGTFGVEISANNGDPYNDNGAMVDALLITVYYTIVPGMAITSDGTGVSTGSALLEVKSTTQGLLLPRMTTAQRNAISGPVAGLLIYDQTLSKPCFYTGSSWQTFSAVAASPGGGGGGIGEAQTDALIQTVQEQGKQIEELKKMNNDLKKEIEELKSR